MMQHYHVECRGYGFHVLLAEPGKDLVALEAEFKRAHKPKSKSFISFVEWLLDHQGFSEPETIDHVFTKED